MGSGLAFVREIRRQDHLLDHAVRSAREEPVQPDVARAYAIERGKPAHQDKVHPRKTQCLLDHRLVRWRLNHAKQRRIAAGRTAENADLLLGKAIATIAMAHSAQRLTERLRQRLRARVQVASRDNFNTIINQGWTGDWDLTPEYIEPRRVQVASMNDNGAFPRGCYLNADIIDMRPIQYPDKIRYRLFIANPVIINTGNRNVRFTSNPVRHIR